MRTCMLHDYEDNASAVDDDYDDVATLVVWTYSGDHISSAIAHTTLECVLAGLCASEGDDDYDEDDAIADRMSLSRRS